MELRPHQLPDVDGLTVAVDTETSGVGLPDDGVRVSVVSIAFRWDGGPLHVFAWPFDQGVRDKFATAQGDLFQPGDPNLDEHEWAALLEWLSRQRLVFHNAKFDLHALDVGTRLWTGWDLIEAFEWDTMVAQRVLDPESSVALKGTCKRLFGEDSDLESALKAKVKRLRKQKLPERYDLLEWYEIEEYAANDARLTLRLYEQQLSRLTAGEARQKWIDIEHGLLRALYRMEQRGIGYDRSRSLEAADQVAAMAAEIAKDLPFDSTLNGAKAYFFTSKGVVPYKLTPKGAPQLDDEVLNKMVKDRIEYAAEYQLFKKLKQAESLWFRGYANRCGDDGRLRTDFKQTFVVSGRMSVQRVNLQAIPKHDKDLEGVPSVRSLFTPKKGHRLVNLDLSQAELRIGAKLAGCDSMMQMLRDGTDFHAVTCEQTIGTVPGDPHFKRDRDIAKRLTFGGLYGIGSQKFKAVLRQYTGIELTDTQAEAYVNRWRALYPEFGWAYRKGEQMARKKGYVKLVGGRISHMGDEFPQHGWNRIVQASLAEFMKLWLIDFDSAPAWRKFPVLTVHDSIVVEIPDKEEWKIVPHDMALRGALMAQHHFDTPMKVDISPWQ